MSAADEASSPAHNIAGDSEVPPSPGRLPSWVKRPLDLKALHEVKCRLRGAHLRTVCEEARCPNITECFSLPGATFLILGDTCTRGCRFCSIATGTPAPPDAGEPREVARAAAELALEHVVITSVTRDDLPDHGAGAFAEVISAVREELPRTTVEVLTPDFGGNEDLLTTVLDARPDVFNHNVETSRRLHPAIRPGASLDRSLHLLARARDLAPGTVTKSGFMVGLGETEQEITELLIELARASVDIVTIGQYLQPTRAQVPVQRYWEPHYFTQWANIAKNEGIRYVIAGPLVRSSYRAREALLAIRNI